LSDIVIFPMVVPVEFIQHGRDLHSVEIPDLVAVSRTEIIQKCYNVGLIFPAS